MEIKIRQESGVDPDDHGYTNLHEFAGGASDGSYPRGSLTLDGSRLYGMTFSGGDTGVGTVFNYVIPEPSSFALVAVGLAALVTRRRR